MNEKNTAPTRSGAGRIGARAAGLGAIVVALVACGDNQENLSPSGGTTAATATPTTTTTGAGGGGGGQAAGGAGGSSAGGSSHGGGAGGGAAQVCLDPKGFEALFTIADGTLCAVARYEVDVVLGMDVPSWGRHGGPLTTGPGSQAGTVELTRFAPPAGATGTMGAPKAEIAPQIADPKAFLGLQALDLPFFEWTALSWTGAYPATQGELFFAKGAAVAARYPVNGPYALAAVGAGGVGRVIYSGASRLDDAQASVNGLYAADSCGASGSDPRLAPKGDGTCAAPVLVDAWGDASGPVAADLEGNVFAVMTSFSGDQEARGWAGSAIARGAPAAKGDVLFTLPGFGSSLAAMAPGADGEGRIAFQPSDPTSFAPMDVVGQRFTVSGGHVAPQGAPAKLLGLGALGAQLTLMTDDAGRLWVGAPDATGKTTFVVLASTTP